MFTHLRLVRDPRVTVSNLLDELLQREGDRVLSIEEGFRRLDGTLTPTHDLSEVRREVAGLARFLVQDAGLRTGERVGIWRTNDSRCFRWFLAVIRAGGIAVPLNPLLSLPEVRRIAAHCGVRILVTDTTTFQAKVRSRLALPVETWIQSDHAPLTLDGFLRPGPECLDGPLLPPAGVGADAPVAIFHTSGTEGIPKGATLSNRALLAGRATAALIAPFLGRRDLALIALPWAHIMAVSAAIYGIMAGITGFCLPRFDVEDVLEAIPRRRITAVIGVPAMLAKIANAVPAPEKLATIRVWLSAGDCLPNAVAARLREYGALARLPGGLRVRPLVVDAYGMVELGGIGMLGLRGGRASGGGLYLPVPPYRVRVRNERGGAARRGEVGECLVKGPGTTSGYWKDPATSAALIDDDGWLRTGDLASRGWLGLVRLAGRSKDVIKCGGYSVYAADIENVLSAHDAVARAAAVGVPHPEKGEVPIGIVELREGATASEEELVEWSRQRLAVYKCPRAISILPPGGMPTGVTQKVLKERLREQLAAAKFV